MGAIQAWLEACCSSQHALPKPQPSPPLTSSVRRFSEVLVPCYPDVVFSGEASIQSESDVREKEQIPIITLVPPGENASPKLLFEEGKVAIRQTSPERKEQKGRRFQSM